MPDYLPYVLSGKQPLNVVFVVNRFNSYKAAINQEASNNLRREPAVSR